MTAHVLGNSCSLFYVSFAAKKTAILFGHRFPAAEFDAVLRGLYVKYCLTRVTNAVEAISSVYGLYNLLNFFRGGVRSQLTEWMSNKLDVLHAISINGRNSTIKGVLQR